MSDDLVDRVAEDLAAGRMVDWTAAMAAASTPEERMQLESLRLLDQIARPEPLTTRTAAVGDTAPVGPAPASNVIADGNSVWGRYILRAAAGSGSYGTVYRAVDPRLDLEVAIKVLHRHVDDEQLKERVIKEGRALAKIRHQNVVRVIGVEFRGDRVGLCTEFVHGETLENELRSSGTFSEPEAIEVGKAVCQALAAVHRAGFIHGDVKARNVMRERDTGRIVLMDFGTGRELQQELESDGSRIQGTAIYMAPEMLAGQGASPATDVYSVGVLLYYLLTRTYPVEGNSMTELQMAHSRGRRTPLGDRRPDLSPAFLRVVGRALAARSTRQATPAALCEELERCYNPLPLWLQRLRTGAIVVGSIVAGVTSLGFVSTYYLNTVLGRSSFVDEGLVDWIMWGLRGILAPVVVSAFTVLAATLIVECLRLLVRVSAPARRVQRSAAALVHRHSLDDVAVLAPVSLLASALALFVTWWYFAPLLGTLMAIFPDIAITPLEQMTLLSPDYGEYHVAYRASFLGTTIACVMLWYPTVRLAIRTRQRIPRRLMIGGGIVLGFSLLFLDFPYRLMTHDIDFEEISWEQRSCHVLGARGDERLIFCGSLPVPRSRVVRADALTPHPVPIEAASEPAGSAAAKRKRSIFKFLLNNPGSSTAERPAS
jgi:Protein kinase domain